MLCECLLYSKVNQLYVYIHPFFFGFPSRLSHYRALIRVPCDIELVLISYLAIPEEQFYFACRFYRNLYRAQWGKMVSVPPCLGSQLG